MLLTRVPGLLKKFGTAASRNTGTAAGNVVVLDASAKLPAVDGSQLTGIAASGSVSPPQGRLTLQTLTPVMTSTQSAKTTIYYTPYVGKLVPIYNGSNFSMTSIGTELSVATSDTTKSPAAIGASKVNDWFVWDDSGTVRIGHGPDWTNDTTRSAGTALTMVDGILLNNAAITNGPGASRGTYVGTTRSNGSSQLDWIYGALAAGGTAGFFGVWNAYNRRRIESFCADNTDSWTYGTASWRSANNSNTMRHSFVCGLDEDGFQALHHAIGYTTSSATPGAVGVGLDSTSAFTGQTAIIYNASGSIVIGSAIGACNKTPGIGFHFVQAIEYGGTGGTTTFIGDNSSAFQQSGFLFSWVC